MHDTPPTSGRIVAVDVLRGLTMAAMIVVNNPGTWRHMYAPLRHAAWGEMLTPADLVFPLFLFLVGVSVPLALDVGIRDGRIKPGQLVLMEAFGGGFTWGSALLKY